MTTVEAPTVPGAAGTARPGPGRLVRGRVEFWYRDLASCLQSTLGTVLQHAGRDPLAALGSRWEFRYIPGDVRPEEFYLAVRHPDDLLHSMAPSFPAHSSWLRPADPGDPLAEVRAAVAADRLLIAAVDNFFLPFRPAFGDVHAAHLLVITGLDENRGLVHVCDAMPPAYAGPLPIADFLRAWGSENPSDDADTFFSDSGIDRRLLDVRLGKDWPDTGAAFVRATLGADRRTAQGPPDDDGAGWVGLEGLRRYLAELLAGARAGDAGVLAQAYPFGWGMQAQAALRGEWLRRWGAEYAVPPVREAGRRIEAVAHAWTGVRMTCAHGLADPAGAAPDLARHATVLRRRYETAVKDLAVAEEAL